MSRQLRLSKRGSKYYFRGMIPKDLHDHYGRKEIVYSLKTRDENEAKRLVNLASLKLDAEFEALRKRKTGIPKNLSVINDQAIETICSLWKHNCLDGDVWYRSHGFSDDESEQRHAEHSKTIELLRETLSKGRMELIQPVLGQFLHLLGIEFCGDDEDRRKLAWAFLETVIDTHLGIMQRDRGEVVRTPPPPRPIPGANPASVRIKNSPKVTPTLHDCFKLWETAVIDRPRATVEAFDATLKEFTGVVGKKPAAEIEYDDIFAFIDYQRKVCKCEPGTVKKKVTFLKAIYNSAKHRLKLPPNPFSGIKVPQPRKRRRRLPLNTDDLNAIYQSPLYTEGERPKGGAGEAAVWLPMLCNYSGARLEELGQLLVEDVRCEHGIWYLDIIDLSDEDELDESDQEKELKNEESRRPIPLHSEVIKAGFLFYVDKQKQQGERMLFPMFHPDTKGKLTGNWSKWWSRYRKKYIGITSRLKPFHSYRHTFRDACREAELGEELADAFMGHASKKTGRGYGSGFSLKALHRAMEKIVFPEVIFPVIEHGEN